jgi:hypothetical protein
MSVCQTACSKGRSCGDFLRTQLLKGLEKKVGSAVPIGRTCRTQAARGKSWLGITADPLYYLLVRSVLFPLDLQIAGR